MDDKLPKLTNNYHFSNLNTKPKIHIKKLDQKTINSKYLNVFLLIFFITFIIFFLFNCKYGMFKIIEQVIPYSLVV